MRQTKTLPLTSVVPISAGLCRLSSVPAGRWPFPTLSLQSLRRCLDPLPRSVLLVHLLASSQETTASPQTSQVRHTELPPAMQLQQSILFRGCSSASGGFRLPRSLDLQVAPTAEAQRLQGSQAVYTTHSSVGYLPRSA
jgi:hypothetical protein